MAFTPKGLMDAITTAATEETARAAATEAQDPIDSALQEALGELAEVQRLLAGTASPLSSIATVDEIATLAENAAEACEKISTLANKVYAKLEG